MTKHLECEIALIIKYIILTMIFIVKITMQVLECSTCYRLRVEGENIYPIMSKNLKCPGYFIRTFLVLPNEVT